MKQPYYSLKLRYLIFLASVILTVIASQFVISYDLRKQNSDANLINLAERQRMLCQRIAKLTLYAHYDIQESGQANQARLDSLKKSLNTLKDVHAYLLEENNVERRSGTIQSLLNLNSANLDRITLACEELIRNPVAEVAGRAVIIVVDNDVQFLELMEKIVSTYQHEAEKKLSNIKIAEWTLTGFTILIVIFGFIYIFMPSLHRLIRYNKELSASNMELRASEEKIRTNLEQIRVLQSQLEVREREYRSLIDNSHDLIAVFDMDGKYTFVSNSCKEMLGYTPEELIGKFGMDFVHPDDRIKLVDEPLKEVFQGRKVLNPEFRLRRKDGQYIWIEAYSTPILDEKGKTKALQTANRDITQRKLVEEALRLSEERYRLVSENSQDFIALHKPDGTYTFVSPSVRTLLGYEPSELLNTSGFDLVHPEDLVQIVAESKDRALTGETVLNTQFRMRKKDGTYTWVEAYTKPIVNTDGNIGSVQTSARDIAQRKSFEQKIIEAKEHSEKISVQLAELLSDKNDLIGLFSHDLRSPMNQIKGMVELMALKLDDAETLKLCLNKMGEVTNRQLTLFEGILSMLRSDQISLQKKLYQKVPLAELISSCIKNCDWEIKAKQISLIVSIPEKLFVNAHPDLFPQAIHNLLSNAIKFTPVRKQIRIVCWEEASSIKIVIQDEGIGFEPSKAERLFDRFTLEGRNGTDNQKSTGLGLYLVRKIINNHCGTIIAESKGAGAGATFTISISKD